MDLTLRVFYPSAPGVIRSNPQLVIKMLNGVGATDGNNDREAEPCLGDN